MKRRSQPQAKAGEVAFPIRFLVLVPKTGFNLQRLLLGPDADPDLQLVMAVLL